MELLTEELLDRLPPLYSQERVEDPLVVCKFFTPDGQWTWYAIEFDGKNIFFGYVVPAREIFAFMVSAISFSLADPFLRPLQSARSVVG